MGRVILIDGPEKAGKTTLIAALEKALQGRELRVRSRRWGQIKPDDRAYTAPLEIDFEFKNTVTTWDRGWPSEYVYGRLLNRQRRGATNPWILEWLHGRAIIGNGARIMVLPMDSTQVAKRRDDTDLPVNPAQECELYLYYAQQFGYDVYFNDYHPQWAEETAELIVAQLPTEKRVSPRYWTNSAEGGMFPRVIVGEARNPRDMKTMAGAWLPFTSARMCAFVQKYFGNEAFRFVWTNADDIERGLVPNDLLLYTSGIYTFGEKAKALMSSKHLDTKASFSHPSYFSRWNTDRGRAALALFETQYKAAFEL